MKVTELEIKTLLESKLKPIPDMFVGIVVDPRSKEESYALHILDQLKANKDHEFAMYQKVTDENPNQIIVIAVGEDLKHMFQPMDLIYITHRYTPVPFLHKGVILHRFLKSDVICTVDHIESMEEFNSFNRIDFKLGEVLKPEYNREPLKN